jgi:hypothetical protein
LTLRQAFVRAPASPQRTQCHLATYAPSSSRTTIENGTPSFRYRSRRTTWSRTIPAHLDSKPEDKTSLGSESFV